MPYKWTENGDTDCTSLLVWPHRSLPLTGFAIVIMSTFLMMTIPLFAMIGTVILWGLLPFVLMTIAGLWFGLRRSYHDGTLREELSVCADNVRLLRREPGGQVREWVCESYWVQTHLYETGGPVGNYITLKGRGREVEIGAFLSEDERKELFYELDQRIRRFKNQ